MSYRFFIFLFCLLMIGASGGFAEEPLCPKPTDRATCPVCGMFVIKYPDWIATVVYADGHAHHFDGVKDLFKYLAQIPKYAPDHTEEMIRQICVTDYYQLQQIKAKEAFFVIGSDILGPMGHELIPLKTREDAEEFSKDHEGEEILRFEQITPEIINR